MGGVEHSTLNLVAQLDRTLWEPVVLCPDDGILVTLLREQNITVKVVSLPAFYSTSIWFAKSGKLPNPFAWIINIVVLAKAVLILRHAINNHQSRLVVTKGLQSHFIGGLAAKSLRIPCVWHVQDFISERFLGIFKTVFGIAALTLPKQIIADGRAIERQLPKSARIRTFVIPNGLNTDEYSPDGGSTFREEYGIPQTAFVIGHVARLTPWKGQDHLLEAYLRLAPSHPDVWLVIVGSALFGRKFFEEQLKKKAWESGYADRIIFTGYRADLPQVLRGFDIFAYPVLEKDTSPLSLLSAMSTGLPLCAYNIDGVCEVIQHSVTGLLVPVGHIGKLSDSIEKLTDDTDLRYTLSVNVRKYAVEQFSLEKYVAQCDYVFRKALG